MSILKCTGLVKKYGANIALDSIDFEIECGGVIGLLGPNGSGKTTFIKLVCGLLTPDSGSIKVGGNDVGVESKKIVAYHPDHMFLSNMLTVKKEIEYFTDFFEDFNPDKARTLLSDLGVDEDAMIGTLSKGNKEKVSLILTMSRAAKLYLLDEPIAGVDPATRDYILGTILRNYSEGSAVVISTHLISDIEPALDRVIFLNKGRIILDGVAENIRNVNGISIDELFREEFKW